MKTLTLIFLIFSLASAKLDKAFVKDFSTQCTRDVSATFADVYLDVLENSKVFTEFVPARYIRSGSGGTVIQAIGNNGPVAVKLMEDDKDFTVCDRNSLLFTLNSKGIKYINMALKAVHTTVTKSKDYYVCVFVTEFGFQDFADPLVYNEYEPNFLDLYAIIGKFMLGVAQVNWKGNLLHGDIKPENLLAVITPEGKIDPQMIDFDLMKTIFQGQINKSTQLRYTSPYRPPEMKILSYNYEKREDDMVLWNKHKTTYVYSNDFLEDVYATGQSIKDILRYNPKAVDTTNTCYTELILLLNQMTSAKSSRPTIKKSLELFIAPIPRCNFISTTLDKLVEEIKVFFDEVKYKPTLFI